MLKKWLAVLVVAAESVFIANRINLPIVLYVIFIILSIIGGMAYILDDCEYGSVLYKMVRVLVAIPIITVVLLFAFSLISGIIEIVLTLGFEGTVIWGVLIAIGFAIFSGCVFIFFF